VLVIKTESNIVENMCGLFGFLALNSSPDRAQMQSIGRAMAKSLSHRGPDDDGLWQDPDCPLLLGHTRLSVIDLSAEGAQPMISASERYVIVYNGEIYNFRELMSDLEASGQEFRGHSDTEILLSAIDQWGLSSTLQKINGMFAFCLWDRKTRHLHFARDRLGKKPLYIGWADNHLLFASELKVYHEHPSFRPQIDQDVLHLYVRYGYVPQPFCIFKGVIQLHAGGVMSLDTMSLSSGQKLDSFVQSYWHHPRVVQECMAARLDLTDDQAIDKYESLLENAVKSRMLSDVPIGALLSGGIDSSLVVALMQKNSEQPVKTFSVGFEESGYNEADFSKAIASQLMTEHHELILRPQDALDVIPKLPEIYDEPFADISQIPTYLISRFARQHVTVALTGDGGDELMGGYNRHFVVPAIWSRVKYMPEPLRRAVFGLIGNIPEEVFDKVLKGKPQIGERIHKLCGVMSLSDKRAVYDYLLSAFTNPEDVLKAGSEPVDPVRDSSWWPEGLEFAEGMIYGDMLSYLPNDVLTKVDRASMASSLETRAPLLDYKLFEFSWRLPLKMKVRGGQGKWLSRQVLSRYLPSDLFERPKMGFSVPNADWLRGPLKEWASDILNGQDMNESSLFRSDKVQALWEAHLAGQGNYARQLWAVLMFASWQKRWIR
jgi:asparagine synthase (glutamine-hydrolysing)